VKTGAKLLLEGGRGGQRSRAGLLRQAALMTAARQRLRTKKSSGHIAHVMTFNDEDSGRPRQQFRLRLREQCLEQQSERQIAWLSGLVAGNS
jgi:hypothetical protein